MLQLAQLSQALYEADPCLPQVYGDIGTSPLYVMASVFESAPTEEEVIGVTSLILWSITALLGVKYAIIVLRADDNGQGEVLCAVGPQMNLDAGHAALRPWPYASPAAVYLSPTAMPHSASCKGEQQIRSTV